jgi:hypothetical protein
MSYLCSDETLIIEFAQNADKIRMVCELMNGSKYRTIAQQFLDQKGILLQCKYSYSVSDPSTQKPASYVFFATDKTKHAYFVKVNRQSLSVSEWYRHDDVQKTNPNSHWSALDITTNNVLEYYALEFSEGMTLEKKFNAQTNQHMVTNYFQVFADMTVEQQELIKDLPFKRTSVGWANKPNGFTVEFLPSYRDMYQGINMDNLHLLEIEKD